VEGKMADLVECVYSLNILLENYQEKEKNEASLRESVLKDIKNLERRIS
jgi:hypothetical protein